MSTTSQKTPKPEFVAIITVIYGSHFVECFLRSPPPAPGFSSEFEPVYSNTNLPASPKMPLDQVKRIALECARQLEYKASEIVWDMEALI